LTALYRLQRALDLNSHFMS